MEEKINIAKILKDKPVNTKLYSPLYGDVYFSYIGVRNNIIVLHHRFTLSDFLYNGRYTAYKESEIMLFPSKDMRDWRKFAWKKGDVLVNSRGLKILFDRWANDNYTSFYAKTINLVEDGFLDTNLHTLASEKEAKSFIKCIEEKLGGKLNRETLEVEKAQPEFKDGDIIKITWDKYSAIVIFLEYSNFGKGFDSHVFFNIKTKIIEYNIHGHILQDTILRLATEEEKKQLFSALEKEGKAWDVDKKQIVDLKPKVEFKPFDKVLCRNSKDDTWEADFFARLTRKEIDYTQSGKYLCVGDLWMYCIPYNEETEHLLGTTDEWKGGEG